MIDESDWLVMPSAYPELSAPTIDEIGFDGVPYPVKMRRHLFVGELTEQHLIASLSFDNEGQ